jgi:hypothetical protein
MQPHATKLHQVIERPQRLRMVAHTLLQLKTYDIALDFFASIRRDWLDWQLQAGQGIAYLGTGKPIKALHVLEKAGTARRQGRSQPAPRLAIRGTVPRKGNGPRLVHQLSRAVLEVPCDG